mmetsp:Transcript_31392/g.56884  ORF Transcript_31392/g.56884 Transcript_31392/m.56884 type:complete len:568 (-) Transcript_31392:43-1746(-)|eukprot:CAMPEP_0197627068 /NCGR_PEP_ID=MMETSP1338-20131121/5775_1 /TAXON_ID=43686 ORGANISM="Pelagodinium beii, Strain RCC1491" /NCGR_SAMPLE_ID=MMETSP1338 /ASSEMBLY_ACC=CAM_ASM_000754 /LENGTH=567 /DNA_ID=CAMNT_0043197685 /DNA_START=68 /DNA_END=1771 /DNA_ORIENTATION=-
MPSETGHVGKKKEATGAASPNSDLTERTKLQEGLHESSQSGYCAIIVHEELGNSRGAFPLEPMKGLAVLIPETYESLPVWMRIIRTFSHLVVLVGSVANLFGMVRVFHLYQDIKPHLHDRTYMAALLTCFLYALCCLIQLSHYLFQYSYEFVEKQAEIRQRKELIAKLFDETVNELDAVLGQSLDAQVTLAERSLEAKRRDCNRALQNIAPKLKRHENTSALLEAVRNFVCMWLLIFAECSIEPAKSPFLVASEDELIEQCKSAVEVADIVSRRIKMKEIKLISRKLADDKIELAKWQTAWKSLRNRHKQTLERATALEEGLRVEGSGDALDAEPKKTRRWLTFGCVGFGVLFNDDNRFPVYLDCGFLSIMVLSGEHARLLSSYLFGLILLCWTTTLTYPPPIVMGLMAVSLTCIAFVLYDFMEFDTVQRLEAQIDDLQQESDRVAWKRKRIIGFYARAQDLGEFWLHRTLPRLELLKQFSEELEDVADVDFVSTMTTMVRNTGSLEQALLPAKLWLDDKLTTATKKQVAAVVTKLTSTRSVKETLQKMPAIVAELEMLKKQILHTQ